MKKPRHPLPLGLSKLTHNVQTGLYEIKEDGILYALTLEQTRELKTYFKTVERGKFLFRNWYNDKSKTAREKIFTKGMPQKNEDDFYPDEEFE